MDWEGERMRDAEGEVRREEGERMEREKKVVVLPCSRLWTRYVDEGLGGGERDL